MTRPVVLFLCTGNYYRSRFAEMYFNHLAEARGLAVRADSRALAFELGLHLQGNIFSETVAKLQSLGVALPPEHRPRRACNAADLQAAQMIIALKEDEHRPLLATRYAGWEDRVTYWHVHDLDAATADAALTEIQGLVEQLVEQIAARKR